MAENYANTFSTILGSYICKNKLLKIYSMSLLRETYFLMVYYLEYVCMFMEIYTHRGRIIYVDSIFTTEGASDIARKFLLKLNLREKF